MVGVDASPSRRVEHLYRAKSDPSFEDILRRVDAPTDAALADLIEADGRTRVRLGRAVSLDRYLAAVGHLAVRVEPLDAAVDVTLRSLSARGLAPDAAVRELVARYPELEGAIREAAELSEAVLSTSSLRRVLTERPSPRSLPQEFGPVLADQRRRYFLTGLLGRGSCGEVYRATDRLLSESGHEAEVAIKILGGFAQSAWARQRFVEEATKARRIIHPNVVRVIDRGGDESGSDYIVYEYVPGGDLQQWGAEHPSATPDEVVRIVVGVARGIQAAHAAGVAHCDLKPSNIVLTADGEPKVADFGVAVRQLPWGPDGAGDEAGAPVGNLAFIAPEQYRMEAGAHAPGADLFAVGGIMYWLATGDLPNGRTLTEIERVHDPKVGRKSPVSIRSIRGDFDRELEAICAKCLASDPGGRYASAAQLADDLSAWQRREPIRWTRPSPARVLSLWARRKPGLAASLGVLAVTSLVAISVTVRLGREASARRRQAGLATAELAGREAERASNARRLQSWWDLMKVTTPARDSWEMLPLIPYMEWAQGTSVLGDPGAGVQPWDDRITIIRSMYTNARNAHGATDFETLHLQTTLAFWLVCDRRIDEAEPLLRENRRLWAAMLGSDNRWVGWIEALEACAVVARFEAASDQRPSATDRERIAAAEAVLLAVWPQLAAGPTQLSIQALIRRSLLALYGPRLLDRPDLAACYRPAPADPDPPPWQASRWNEEPKKP